MKNNFVGNPPKPNENRISPVGGLKVSPSTRIMGAQRVSPNRGGISNLNGQVNMIRRAQGLKIAPGQTNFLDRNRERLAEI